MDGRSVRRKTAIYHIFRYPLLEYVLYSKKASITKSSLDRIKATQEELKRKWKAKQTGA